MDGHDDAPTVAHEGVERLEFIRVRVQLVPRQAEDEERGVAAVGQFVDVADVPVDTRGRELR